MRYSQSLPRRSCLVIALWMAVSCFTVPLSLAESVEGPRSSNSIFGDKLISIEFQDAELPSVLKAIAHTYDLNLIMAKGIEGKVSAVLKDVTVEEALNAILKVNGLSFRIENKVIYVTAWPGLEGIDQVTVPIQLKYLTAKDGQDLLSKMISSKGSIQVNAATNSLVITDFPLNIDKMKNLLETIDIPPIQVLIEAKIVDIQSNAYQNLGTTFNATYDPKGSSLGAGLFERDSQANESLTAKMAMAGPSSTLTGGQFKFTPTLKSLSADITIDALIQENKAHVLASPSIATLNGKEARIIIGERFPFKETTQTQTSSTNTTKFIDVGTTLRVIPMVSPDDWITMKVHPEVSSVAASLDAGPRITTREADSEIRVKDRQTIIIGGLIKKKDDRVNAGIPVLRSIPILGALFSKKSSDLEDTELTVFITPHIIREPNELKDKKGVVEEEARLNLGEAGDLTLVKELFEYARKLEDKESIQSAHALDLNRNLEIIETYKLILKQFPATPRGDLALFKIGSIYFDVFDKYAPAEAAFQELIKRYPESEFKDKSNDYLKSIEEKIKTNVTTPRLGGAGMNADLKH